MQNIISNEKETFDLEPSLYQLAFISAEKIFISHDNEC